MFDQFSEPELLAYIEDDLDAAQRAEMTQRLDAAHPRARSALDRMRDDRTLLRSAVEPDLPLDFLNALEPQLARPMLIDRQPGSYRRRHHRRRSVAKVARYAIAAVLLIACFSAIWYVASTGTIPPEAAPGERIASDTTTDEPAGELAETPGLLVQRPPAEALAEGDWPPPGTAIWHERPLPPGAGSSAVASAAPGSAPGEATGATPGPAEPGPVRTFPATFALVLAGEDAPQAEALIARALEQLAGPPARGRQPDAALVQNLTFAEATALARRYAGDDDDEAPDRITGADRGAGRDPLLNRRELLRALNRIHRQRTAGDEPIRISRQLLGPGSLAASYEQQLDFSEAGATHTITVPASKLADLLAHLRLDEGRATMLRPLVIGEGEGEAAGETASEGDSLSQWVSDLATLNAFLADLRSAEDDAAASGRIYILLPVVVEAEGR